MAPDQYDFNSTHCVNAYELSRGVDADATPLRAGRPPGVSTAGGRFLADIDRVWGRRFREVSRREIKRSFKRLPAGARAIVALGWRFGGGHVLNVETVRAEIKVDGPKNLLDASSYFSQEAVPST